MILVFDLDDTLYDERTYVLGGFRAVASHGKGAFGWDARAALQTMTRVLDTEGRGAVFDAALRAHATWSAGAVAECLAAYRSHRPRLRLFPAAARMLRRYQGQPLYLVTDGNKLVQWRKVVALGLTPLFRRVLITHRFGLRHAKPSTHCFDLIRRAEGCRWEELVHIADNPAKDFVNLNPLGVRTVRVLTGSHAAVRAARGHDAQTRIRSLDELPAVLDDVRSPEPAFTRSPPAARPRRGPGRRG